MFFGLTNTSASFQNFINNVLALFLDRFVTVYLGNILIYLDNLTQHRQHMCSVLEELQEADLYLKAEKCEFHQVEVSYLGLIIGNRRIHMDGEMEATISEWLALKCVFDVRCFVRFGIFYRRFIRGFSSIFRPRTPLTGKAVKFLWQEKKQKAFETLNEAFVTAPLLWYFEWTQPVVVETDTSDLLSASMLSQRNSESTLCPFTFYSKRHSPAEDNYEIYDKELIVIVEVFQE